MKYKIGVEVVQAILKETIFGVAGFAGTKRGIFIIFKCVQPKEVILDRQNHW